VLEAWPSCSSSLLTLVATLAVRSSFGWSAGVVFALCSDWADFEAALCRYSECTRVKTSVVRPAAELRPSSAPSAASD